jgi:hypothetical protein
VIPRVVHYCWLSGAPWDALTTRCFQSWQDHLTGFDFRLWDRARAPSGVPFLDRMLANGDWAFASDYLRLHALYTVGGVYLDLDVEVLRSFAPLLDQRAFLSYEDAAPARLACHVIGAEPGHPFVAACLEFYRRSWRLRWSFPPTMPRIVTRVARRRFGLGPYRPEGQVLKDDVRIHPAETFTPVSSPGRDVSRDSYALHHWRHGWSWLERPLRQAVPKIPWLFMTPRDWRFVVRHLVWNRLRARFRAPLARPTNRGR